MAHVLSPFYPVAARWEVSHRAGWAAYWAHALGAKLLTSPQYTEPLTTDAAYLYHGMEWGDALNLQGGLTAEVADRCQWYVNLLKSCRRVISLDVAMPSYKQLFEKRLKHDEAKLPKPTLEAFKALDWEAWGRLERKIGYEAAPFAAETLVAGDSHSLSQVVTNSVIRRHDGLTLHGALRRGLVNVAGLGLGFRPQHLVLYLGNIDLRHHLARPGASPVEELVGEYAKQVKALVKEHQVPQVTIVAALPINADGRRIPQTGWHKGTPFYGSWAARDTLRQQFNEALRTKFRGFKVRSHPKHFSAGEVLSPEVMEKPGSVHIRPAEYRLIHEGQAWNV